MLGKPHQVPTPPRHHSTSNPTTNQSADLATNKLKLRDFILSLGEYLTSDDIPSRTKVLGYLAAVLQSLDPKILTRHNVSLLTDFLRNKLEDDQAALKEVAQGLLALVNMTRFTSQDAESVVVDILKLKDGLRKHPQSTRFVVLTVVDTLLAKFRETCKKLADTFVDGYLELVGGEKDPRNLMIVFSALKVIIIEFDIERHVDVGYPPRVRALLEGGMLIRITGSV